MWALLYSLSFSFHFVSDGCHEDATVLIMVFKVEGCILPVSAYVNEFAGLPRTLYDNSPR